MDISLSDAKLPVTSPQKDYEVNELTKDSSSNQRKPNAGTRAIRILLETSPRRSISDVKNPTAKAAVVPTNDNHEWRENQSERKAYAAYRPSKTAI